MEIDLSMSDLNIVLRAGIYALMLVSIIGAIASVTLKNLFHSALALAGALIGVAGIYIGLHAEFLAMIQILVYVGAVMTIVIFAIMLTERAGSGPVKQNNRQSLPALVVTVLFLICLFKMIYHTAWPVKPAAELAHHTSNLFQIGNALLTSYVFPFEVIGILLTAALVGAIVIARKDKKEC